MKRRNARSTSGDGTVFPSERIVKRGKKRSTRGNASTSARLASPPPPVKENPAQVEYFKDIFATIREPLLVLDSDLRVLAANRSFYKFFKVKPGETVGNLVYDLGNRQWNIPALRTLLETILPQKAVFNDFEVEYEFPVIGGRILLLNARRIPAPPKEPQWILLAFEDVTLRRRAQEKLASSASEAELRALFAAMTDVVIVYDIEGRYIKIAPTNPANLYRPPDEMQGKTLQDVLPKKQADYIVSMIRKSIQNDQVVNGEYALELGGKETWFTASASRLSETTAILVAHDITNRRQAEESLRESEERFHSLYENATIGIYRTTPDGRIVMANPALVRMLGYQSFEELAQRDLTKEGYEPEYPRREFQKRIERDGEVRGLESAWKHKNGSTIYVRENVSLVWDEKNQPLYYEGTVEDITERKHAEEALSESEEKYRNVVERANDGIAIIQDAIVKYLNPRLAELWGGTVEEVIGTPFTNFIHTDELPAVLDRYQRRMAGEEVAQTYETVLKRKDGSKAYVELNAGTIMFQGKSADLAIVRDITERKLAEQALRNSEEKLKVAQIIGRIGNWEYETKSQKITWSDQTYRLYERDPLKGPPSAEEEAAYYSPEQAQTLREFARLAIETGQDFDYDLQANLPSGNQMYLAARMQPIKDAQGQVIKLFGTVQDITERKLSEQTLQKSEKRFLALMEHSMEEISLVDSDGTLTWESPTSHRPLGYPPNSFVGHNIFDLFHPDERAAATRLLEQIREHPGSVQEASFRLRHQDGSWRRMEAIIANLLDEPAVQSIVINYRDITERKQTQILQEAVYRIAAAAETTRSLDELYPQIHQIISSVMPAEYFYITLYDEVQNLLRFPYFKDAEDEPFVVGIQPGKGLSAYVLRTGKSLLCTQAVHDELERLGEVTLLGVPSAIWLGVPLIVEGKTIGAMVVQHYSDPKAYGEHEQHMLEFVSTQVAIAINRKRMEEKLEEERILLRTLIDNLPDRVYVMDVQGRKIISNIADWQAAGGKTMEDVIGKTDLDTYPPELAKDYWALDKAVIDTGISIINREEPGLDSQGNPVWVLSSKVPLHDGQGNVVGLVGVGRDITERKRVEEEIHKSNEDLTLLNAINTAVNRGESLVAITNLISENLKDIFSSLGATLHLVNANRSRLVMQNMAIPTALVKGIEKIIGRSIPHLEHNLRAAHPYRQVFESGKSQLINDLKGIQEFTTAYLLSLQLTDKARARITRLIPAIVKLIGRQSIMVVPLVSGNKIIGTLDVGSQEPYTEGDLRRLENIAAQFTSAIQRKQAEEEILQLNAELEQRVEERTRQLRDAQQELVRKEKLAVLGQLAGAMGHELRNPLGIISSAVYYLKLVQPDAGGKVREYHAMLEQEVRTADKIITDLLDFARTESMQREPVAVLGLLQRVLVRFPVPQAVTAVLKIPAGLPMVFADPQQMEQVLGNLTINACQAMPQGGRLTLSARRQKEMVAIAVKDTGVGIPPENMKEIFEPLFTTKPKGIGLGLAVSQKLARANGGRIEVKSEPGKGSTFTVWLPIYSPPQIGEDS